MYLCVSVVYVGVHGDVCISINVQCHTGDHTGDHEHFM